MRLTWDNVGEKSYKVGLDHGVLYPYYDDYYHSGVAWNGLTGIDPNTSGGEATNLFSNSSLNDIAEADEVFGGTIRCYTYPDEFEVCLGYEEPVPGVYFNAQGRLNFGLCYRTFIGNDIDGIDAGFEIHIIYNSIATSSDIGAATIGESLDLSELSFGFSSIPEYIDGYRPVSHIRISSLKTDPKQLNELLDLLYGTDDADPVLPLPDVVLSYLTPVPGSDDEWNGYPESTLYPSNTLFPYSGS